jgi:SAM-dependent methyltransferase
MKNQAAWAPTKFELSRGRWRGSRDRSQLAVGSRLMGDLVAGEYQRHLCTHATGRLLDLGCGDVPLYGAYEPYVAEITCLDWNPGQHIDVQFDLSQPLPFDDGRFDTIILSDVLEHLAQPEQLWAEMSRVLAPVGKIIMNVPFYYSVHERPHDYYRYTNFALERFVQMNGLELLHLSACGGIIDILVDLIAKGVSKAPFVGPPLAILAQAGAHLIGRTRLGARVAEGSSRHFPFGYFMIARCPAADSQ